MSRKVVGRWLAAVSRVARRRWGRLATAAGLGLFAFSFAELAIAGAVFTGQFGTGNTWNMYEAIGTPFTFKEALAFSSTRSDPTGGAAVGHLVTLLSQAENNFVQLNASGNRWIGLSDRVGVAPGAMESQFMLDPLTEGWKWVTGEPFSFQAWGGGEPNNAGVGEDAVHLRGDNLWNDNASGFGMDEPVADFDSTAEGQTTFPFVIEWSTNLATMPTGFPTSRPDPGLPRVFPTPLARLPGPNGTAASWGAMDVINGLNSGTTRDAVNYVLASTPGERVNGTYTLFDIIDPATNAGTVGTIDGPTEVFVAGGGDNFQSVVKGTIAVPAGQGGDYTFYVRSDDGFGMRILSQKSGGPLTQHKFHSARTGNVDEDGSLVFLAPTGDSNTQGVINLAPGTYDVEFLMYENGGGAFFEVSTAKGDFINPAPGAGSPQWVLLGDGSSKPQVGPFNQAARLTGNVTVKNYDFQPDIASTVSNFRSNPTPTAQGMFDEAILYDGDDICCGRPAANLPASQINEFPNGGPDNFSTVMTGQFQVLDTNGAPGETLTFGLFTDDNSALNIIGQSFTGVGGDVNAVLGNPEGGANQWLVADFRTGNSNAYGLINLAEGNYNFEAFQLEEGGDSGLEIWVAAGDHLLDGIGSGSFLPLSTAVLPPGFLAANTGLARVNGPGTGPTGINGDFNGNGVVDAADYVLWRNGGPLLNDATPGVQPGDYDVWKANFGRSAGSGSVAGASVPEATSLLSAAIAMLLGFVSARVRRS